MSQCLRCSREAEFDSNYCSLHDDAGGSGGDMNDLGPAGDAPVMDEDLDISDDDTDVRDDIVDSDEA